MMLILFDWLTANLQKSYKSQANCVMINCCRMINIKGPGLWAKSSKSCNGFLKLLHMTAAIGWPSFMTKWYTLLKNTLKNVPYFGSMTTATFGVDGMVQNNPMTWNKKVLKLCLKDFDFRIYHLLADVNFNEPINYL